MVRESRIMPTPDEIRKASCKQVFGSKVVQNDFRSVVAECLVARALGEHWQWCSADWSGWDFEHREGKCRLEVKQSARLQTWKSARRSSPRFDIQPRKGFYRGSEWVSEPGRNAAIYVFCWHPLDGNEADHFDYEQWEFYVAKTVELPDQKSIGLSPLKKFSVESNFKSLACVVEKTKCQIP